MKEKLSLILLTLITLLSSCIQDKHTSSLEGEWELRTEIDRQTSATTNYLPGNGTILKFTGTDYEIYSHEKFVKSGKYTVEGCKTIYRKDSAERIVYDDQLDSLSFNSCFKIDGNNLSIYVGAGNRPSVIYTRIKS
ncbi:hypothetical protein [Pedobacter hartonius]|uniref:Lipocalin-like domain-containing protein n=1 Tax=Pedobacter hartonius TaxID=425514 RepID=A0A1H4H885_9SPHI|nr:hypothetical protein [Pedobacter hartonius]SEB18053.1 hypothetical protein SAMN05443550_11455 [Pedobacter hartonius]